jgi:hypothetical protein
VFDRQYRHMTSRRYLKPVLAAATLAWLLSVGSAVGAAPPTDLHASYGAVLAAHVDEHGLVSYRALKEHPAALAEYLDRLAKLDPADVASWPDEDRIALYLNAYNAFTLEAILDHYPIQPGGFFASIRFPKNSIRQIRGVWDTIEWKLLGANFTLDQIEHEILRKQFNEPRIHMALVCAAKGCPPLRNEPYLGKILDAQLEDQARRFMADPAKFRVDRERGVVSLSSIFKWFAADFVKRYGDGGPAGFDVSEKAVLNFVARCAKPADADYVRAGGFRIEYLDYDWTLNEQ